MVLLAFLVAVTVVPGVLGGVALLAGLTAQAGERRFVLVVAPVVVLGAFTLRVHGDDGWGGYATYLLVCTLLALTGLLVALGKTLSASGAPVPPQVPVAGAAPRPVRRVKQPEETVLGRSIRRGVARTERQRRGAWKRPLERAVLSHPEAGWRYTLEGGDRVVHGGLPDVADDAPVEQAQQALLDHVAGRTGVRYDASWTPAPGARWTAELVVPGAGS